MDFKQFEISYEENNIIEFIKKCGKIFMFEVFKIFMIDTKEQITRKIIKAKNISFAFDFFEIRNFNSLENDGLICLL